MSRVTISKSVNTALSEALSLSEILDPNTIELLGDEFQDYLASFADHDDFFSNLTSIFGEAIDVNAAANLRQQLQTGATAAQPSFSIVSSATINNAAGAFAQETNTIYLAEELLFNQSNNPAAILNVLLEEYGHFIDSQINVTDAPGDEGVIFANFVQDIQVPTAEQQALRQANDSVVIKIDDEQINLQPATDSTTNTAFDRIGLTQLRNDPTFAGIDGSNFSVAVIDTGLDGDHPLLEENFEAFVDFVAGSQEITDAPLAYDIDGHGTHVAGTVASSDENIGVATDAGLIGLQVFETPPPEPGTSTSPEPTVVLEALKDSLEWVLAKRESYKITAVNMSLGGGFFTPETDGSGDIIAGLIQQLEDAGVTVVSAAGNRFIQNQTQNLAYPAIFSTLAVGSVWKDDTVSSYLWKSGAEDKSTDADRIVSHSQRLDAANMIFAPGALINSTIPGGGQKELGGTSMASPHVAGSVALLQEVAQQFGQRTLSPDEIANFMRSSAKTITDGDDEDTNVTSTDTDYLRLNVYAAAVAVRASFDKFNLARWGTGQGGFWDEQKWLAGDFNGDGKDDTAKVFDDYGLASIDTHLSDGSGFAVDRWGTGQGGFWDEQQWLAGDFNGDGTDDLAKVFNDYGLASIDTHLSDGSSFAVDRWGTGQGGFWNEQKWLAGDFNGDGTDDVAKVFNDYGLASIDTHLSDGSGFAIDRWGTGQGGFWDEQKWLVGDFNGDGLDDLVKVFDDYGLASIDVHTSTGSGFAIDRWGTGLGGFWDAQKWVVGDFNNDGLDDIAKAFSDHGFGSIDVHISSGSGFAVQRWANAQGGFWDAQKWLVGDFNGNGFDDLAKTFNDNGLASIDVHANIA